MRRMSRADRRVWESAATLPELGELTARWIEGTIRSRPGYEPRCGPAPETTHLIPTLAAANRAGFVTDASQPGDCWEDIDGTRVWQRAAVEGFADAATLAGIRGAVARTDLEVLVHDTPPRRWLPRLRWPRLEPWGGGIPVTGTTDVDVCTVFGARMTRSDVKTCFDECSNTALRAVLAAHQVTVVDPELGRDELLWPVLAEWAQHRGAELWAIADEVTMRGSVTARELGDTTRCPHAGACEGCGGGRRLQRTTVDTEVGPYCATLCRWCEQRCEQTHEGPATTTATAAWRILGHAEHVGMATGTIATDMPSKRTEIES